MSNWSNDAPNWSQGYFFFPQDFWVGAPTSSCFLVRLILNAELQVTLDGISNTCCLKSHTGAALCNLIWFGVNKKSRHNEVFLLMVIWRDLCLNLCLNLCQAWWEPAESGQNLDHVFAGSTSQLAAPPSRATTGPWNKQKWSVMKLKFPTEVGKADN